MCKCLYFTFILKDVFAGCRILDSFLFFSCLHFLLYHLFAYMVSNEKCDVSFVFVPVSVTGLSPLVAFKIFCLSLVLSNLIITYLGVVFFVFHALGVHLVFWVCVFIVFIKFVKILAVISSIFFYPFLFPFRGSSYLYIRPLLSCYTAHWCLFIFSDYVFPWVSFWMVLLPCP